MLKKKSDICLVNCWRHRNPFIKWVIFHLSSGINSDKIPGWLPKVGNNKESRISWQDVAIWPRLLVCRLARKTLIYGTKKKNPSHSEPENKKKSRVTGNFLPEALIFALTNPQYDDRFFIELQVPCHLRKTYLGKGQLNSEWIFEVIVSPKMPTKHFPDFCPGSLLEGRAEILKIFGSHFRRNENFINSFWICLTFRVSFSVTHD